ncbi:MAG: type ISP restriction/modification enzyme [Fimbriimonas sp.]
MNQHIQQYYSTLEAFRKRQILHEGALETAMLQLLSVTVKDVNWYLTPKQRLPNGKVPDGTVRDSFNIPRGYWEAKDTNDNLDAEIDKKIAAGYPLYNTIFEDTQRAVLFQGKNNRYEYNLRDPKQLVSLLNTFTSYEAPDVENFYNAVEEFSGRLPDLAEGLLELITKERKGNSRFKAAFSDFIELCRTSLNPDVTPEVIEEMLVQHLLTERLFRTVFDNPDFTRRNVIAAEIEKVIDALTSRAFDRNLFLKTLDPYYRAIEAEGRKILDWNDKQGFLNRVYERFFQGFSTRLADTMGIVYTPQEIVSYMCASADYLLQEEFGKSLGQPGVKILDPCTGTGNFLVRIIRDFVPKSRLEQKIANDLFANEIMLLPYYIASLNIEHCIYEQLGEYIPFEGLCFTDTLDLAEDPQSTLFAEKNTKRVERQQEAAITVIIGNPPYNIGQENENDNNKNRSYPVVDSRISKTYARSSSANLKKDYYDAYIRFLRWASDRLGDSEGIVCFVTNNSFVHDFSLDGVRHELAKDFSLIYHLDCGVNVRKFPGTSGTTHNVFGIQPSVGISFFVKKINSTEPPEIYFDSLTYTDTKENKLLKVKAATDIRGNDWTRLHPNGRCDWITEGMRPEFQQFTPLYVELSSSIDASKGVFLHKSPGINSGRDEIVYGDDKAVLLEMISKQAHAYNQEVGRWVLEGRPSDIDKFVSYDYVQWSEHLKKQLERERIIVPNEGEIIRVTYRPFYERWLYLDDALVDRAGRVREFYYQNQTEANLAICVPGRGNRKPFGCLATKSPVSYDLAFEKVQYFPRYRILRDGFGMSKEDNVNPYVLQRFSEVNGRAFSADELFAYVYAVLHSPIYRQKYAQDLTREIPRIPLSPDVLHLDDLQGDLTSQAKLVLVENYISVGMSLLSLHADYDELPEFPLKWVENPRVPFSWFVEKKMKFNKLRSELLVNKSLMLTGIPPEAFQYKIGNKSPIEWIVDQYWVERQRRTGATRNPNSIDNPDHIVKLVGKSISLSLETQALIRRLGS